MMPKTIPSHVAEPLIAAVRKREILYNTTLAGYKNRSVTIMAWNEIGKELQRDALSCKATWASLRATFNRSLCNTYAPSGLVRPPKWYLFRQMNFLKKYLQNGQYYADWDDEDGQGLDDDETQSDPQEEPWSGGEDNERIVMKMENTEEGYTVYHREIIRPPLPTPASLPSEPSTSSLTPTTKPSTSSLTPITKPSTSSLTPTTKPSTSSLTPTTKPSTSSPTPTTKPSTSSTTPTTKTSTKLSAPSSIPIKASNASSFVLVQTEPPGKSSALDNHGIHKHYTLTPRPTTPEIKTSGLPLSIPTQPQNNPSSYPSSSSSYPSSSPIPTSSVTGKKRRLQEEFVEGDFTSSAIRKQASILTEDDHVMNFLKSLAPFIDKLSESKQYEFIASTTNSLMQMLTESE